MPRSHSRWRSHPAQVGTGLLLLALGVRPVVAQQALQDSWVTNGFIYSVKTVNNTIYAGGTFTLVGPPTGAAVALNEATGVLLQPWPRVNGTVRAVAPDGSGGWYIGGLFSLVQGVARSNLAHIDANGAVTSWNPGTDDYVSTIKRSGDRVYVGGLFTSAGGAARSRVAAIDAATGVALSWNPNATGFTGPVPFGITQVKAIEVHGNVVYLGGTFAAIGGVSRAGFAEVEASTGAPTSWAISSDQVHALEISGTRLYVGSGYDAAGRVRVFEMETHVSIGNPTVFSGQVNALAVDPTTSIIYAGGAFTVAGGIPRNRVAALDGPAGGVTAWNPNANSIVYALELTTDGVFVGGMFSALNGVSLVNLAKVDFAAGNVFSWSPNPGSNVYALAAASGVLYVGGNFTLMNGVDRRGLAAFDATTGVATSWNPGANNTVLSLLPNGNTLYVGGLFSTVAGQTRNGGAAFDATTGALTGWNPNVIRLGSPGNLHAMDVVGNTIYLGGDFTQVGGVNRLNFAAVDATTGALSSWYIYANDPVYALRATSGPGIPTTIYLGGAFTNFGGFAFRNRLAAIETGGGSTPGPTVTAWNPNANGAVFDLALVKDASGAATKIYAGGGFTTVSFASHPRLVEIDAAGAPTAWDPGIPEGAVGAVEVAGNIVYVGGGSFTTVGGQPRSGLAAIDATTGDVMPWNPVVGLGINAGTGVNSLARLGSYIVAGGSFTSVGNVTVGNIATIENAAPQAQVFEITRELGAPEHHYVNNPPFFTSASDVMPFPAAPNVSFAISDYSTIRLRLVAPPGKKFVATRAVYLSWPGDLNLIPIGSTNSGPLHLCPTSWSFTTLAGTAPVSTVEGYKTDGDWLKIRATGTSASSASFEFTEIVLEWNVIAFSGSSHTYAMSDAGGWITGPEMTLYETLQSGAPDPGQAVFLQDIAGSCSEDSGTWPVCGAPVAVKPGAQLSPSVAIDGSGGAWVSYSHADSYQAGNLDLWLNHLDASGRVVSGWPADGFPVCELPSDPWASRVVADGSGGAIVAWHDTRNDPGNLYYDIYLKRITASGALASGWPADGLCPHTITPVDDEFIVGLVGDGTGGAYVLWSGARLSRITGSGTIHPSWPAGGLVVDADAGSSQLLADGAGGAYVCWNTVTDLRIVRITPLGAIASGWPAAGVVLLVPGPGGFLIDLASDGSHVNVGWGEGATGVVRATRVTSGGSIAAGWDGGIVVSNTPNPKSNLTIANGGVSGDVVLVWRENLPDPAGFQVVAQRLTPTGAVAPGWPAAGWLVIPDGRNLRAFPDCAGGTTLAFSSDGIKAIRFTQAGALAPGWPQGGVLLCGGSFQSEIPGAQWASPDGTGGVITVMTRIPQGPGDPWDRADVHALCVRGDGSADEGYAGGTPVGSNVLVQLGPASVTFPSVTAAGETWLELGDSGPPPPSGLQIVPSDPAVYYDVTTAAQYQGPLQICITYDPSQVQGPESGLQLWHYDDTAQPPGWVGVTTSIDEVNNVICGSTPSLSPFIIVERNPTDASSNLPSVHRLLANVPNPFNPKTTIRYEIPSGDDLVRLEIHDVSGRLVRTLVNARQGPGRHEAVWDGRDERGRSVASGIYFYRLQAGFFVATRRMVLLK